MKSLPFSKIRNSVLALAILILIFAAGYRLGEKRTLPALSGRYTSLVNPNPPATSTLDLALFWDVWERLRRNYIEPAALDAKKMVYGAITGMVSSLGDPYTAFLPPKENKEFKEDLGGEFEGIGAQLGIKDGRVIVVAPLKGTPAAEAGIRPGDYILKVNDEDTAGWTVPQAVTKIRGPKGTEVRLSILHENAAKPSEIAIIRGTITVPSVETWVKKASDIDEIASFPDLVKLPGKVAYLRLSRFGEHTNEDWGKAVAEIVAAQRANGLLKGLVFDLRNNPGGYLDGSVFIASEFLRSGVVVSQVNSDGTKEDFRVNRKGTLFDIPMVVLVNKGSASAAEIVAGALKDYKRAVIVGEVTFGKGSVQTPFDLSEGAGLHITTGKWLLPKGDSISKVGVAPNVEIKLDDPPEASRDAQLAKAIELLLK